VTFLLAASLSFGADVPPAGPPQATPETPGKRRGAAAGRAGGRKAEEARLDAVKIVGDAEHPAILFFLPRGKFRLLPLRPEQDPAARILRDDKLSAETPGS
jgi:hypothetical protein